MVLKEILVRLQKLLCLKLPVKGCNALLEIANHMTVTCARHVALVGQHCQEADTLEQCLTLHYNNNSLTFQSFSIR